MIRVEAVWLPVVAALDALPRTVTVDSMSFAPEHFGFDDEETRIESDEDAD